MRAGWGTRALNHFGDISKRRVKPKGVVSSRQVLVNRFWNPERLGAVG